MLTKLSDKFFEEKEELIDSELAKKDEAVSNEKLELGKKDLIVALGIFFLALIPRLVYVFIVSNPNLPGWYTDVFHHWQIAYLSKEIGFDHGFLRLWDFKGMEFFWGLLHPLVLIILFDLTGSISIIIPRLLSTVGGSISIVFIYFIVRRFFGKNAALASAIFASFFPITLFSNTVGMQEELAVPLILGGILLWPRAPLMVGILLVLASMVRAEYWLFAVGLIGAGIILRRNLDKVLILVLSYSIMIFAYMKYLANYTGNYIYPIYWNFLASVRGDWFVDLPIVGEKLLAKQISQGIFVFGLIGAIVTLVKRPKHAFFFLFGFGNIIFIGFMVGFGAYVKGYIPRFWVDRLYNWPYLFTATFIIILLFYYLPKKLGRLKNIVYGFAWFLLLCGILISQLIWKPINYFMQGVESSTMGERALAQEVSKAYRGGTILLPEDHAQVTYFLAHDYNVSGENMVGQMFDPFFYFPDKENPFDNWGEDREKVLNWLKDNDIRLIVLTNKKPTYMGLIKREPTHFELIPSVGIFLYRVKF